MTGSPRARTAVVAAALLILAAPAAATAAPARSTVAGSVLRGLSNAQRLGAVPADTPLTIGLGLRGRDPAGLTRFVGDLYDKRSPAYHHFLTPARFEARFGVPAARTRAAAAWLRAGGLHVTRIGGADSYLLARGPAASVERLLSTRLERFAFQGHTYFANTRAPRVPARLGALAVTGLNDFEGPRLLRRSGPHRVQLPQLPHTLGPDSDLGNTKPSDLWSIYDQPAGNKGDGQQMAIFGWGTTNNTEGDLRLFEHEHRLPAIPLAINYYGPADEKVTDAGGEEEWDIDTQASTGMAPDAVKETMYMGKAGSDADLIAAYNAWAADPDGALQGSSSFGGCEQAPVVGGQEGSPGSPSGTVIVGNPNQALYEQALTKVVAEGRTMFASSGDTGAGCPAVSLVLNGATIVPTPMLNYPAVSPHAVAVGGTVLYFDDASGGKPASRALEYGWPYGGGGTSLFMAAPDWQANAVTLAGRCPTDPAGTPYVPPPPCRGIPDVAAQSGDIASNGYAITVGGAPDQSGGGTSLSSPLWLGMWTRIQAAQSKPAGNGFAAPALYAIGSKPGMFFDVGGVSTDTVPTCNGATPINCSHPGWDYVTGWGTPDVTNIMKTLDGGNTSPVSTPPLQPQPSIDVGRTTPCPAPQITDPTGDAPNNYPGGDGSNIDSLDIASATFDTTKDSTGAAALGVTLQVKNLDTDPFLAAMDSASWDVHWTAQNSAGDEVSYDAQATRDLAGPATLWSFDVTGSDGSSFAVDGTATTGANGSLRWVIPLSDIGSPADGAELYETFADTRGTISVLGTGLQFTAAADRGPDGGFGAVWDVGGAC